MGYMTHGAGTVPSGLDPGFIQYPALQFQPHGLASGPSPKLEDPPFHQGMPLHDSPLSSGPIGMGSQGTPVVSSRLANEPSDGFRKGETTLLVLVATFVIHTVLADGGLE